MTAPVFITGTGTGVGKTWVTRGLAGAAVEAGLRVAALKPYETGVDPDALDARALAHAAGRPERALDERFYRARPPLSPHAATLAGEPPPPPIPDIIAEIRARAEDAQLTLVEGAGGLLVPLSPETLIVDLAVALEAELLIVAKDGLGVLSHTLTAVECARTRALPIRAIVLTPGAGDLSQEHNRTILETWTGLPVIHFPQTTDDDTALSEAARTSGLLQLLTTR